jgi:hypothetical protein
MDDSATDNLTVLQSGHEKKRILNTSQLFRRKTSKRMYNEEYDAKSGYEVTRGS